MFSARPGYVLISSDYSAQEPRVLADRSQDPNLIRAYNEGKDLYCEVASLVYKVPYEECKEFRSDGTKNPEGKERRTSMKSVILGIMYSRGAKGIADQLNISEKEAQGIIDMFYQHFPKVKSWQDSVIKFAKENGYVETAWGRKRRLPDMQLPQYGFESISNTSSSFDLLDFDAEQENSGVDSRLVRKYTKKLNETWKVADKMRIVQEARDEGVKITLNGAKIEDARRQCVNSIIQGSSADVTKKAMIAINTDDELKKLDCHLLLTIHDEVICECPEENYRQCAKRITELMIGAPKERISVPMKNDIEVTRVWYGEELEV